MNPSSRPLGLRDLLYPPLQYIFERTLSVDQIGPLELYLIPIIGFLEVVPVFASEIAHIVSEILGAVKARTYDDVTSCVFALNNDIGDYMAKTIVWSLAVGLWVAVPVDAHLHHVSIFPENIGYSLAIDLIFSCRHPIMAVPGK